MLLILDVRSAEEYEAGNLPAALLLPYDEIGAVGNWSGPIIRGK